MLRVPSPLDRDAADECACDGIDPLAGIGFHEARHSYSSFLDACGVSETRADRYMGHANYSTRARYTHQLEAQLAEDAQRLDDYLRAAVSGKVVPLDAERRSA
jgi:integrase